MLIGSTFMNNPNEKPESLMKSLALDEQPNVRAMRFIMAQSIQRHYE